LIRVRYGGIAHSPVPDRLDLDRLARQERQWTWFAAAAVVAAFLVGGTTGWLGPGPPPPGLDAPAVTAGPLDAHQLHIAEVRHAIEVPADAAHLIPWLSRRVGSTLRAPDLAPFGLKLMGGRLLPGQAGKAAAMLMYETASGDRYTLYCSRAGAPETAHHYNPARPAAAGQWVEGPPGSGMG